MIGDKLTATLTQDGAPIASVDIPLGDYDWSNSAASSPTLSLVLHRRSASDERAGDWRQVATVALPALPIRPDC